MESKLIVTPVTALLMAVAGAMLFFWVSSGRPLYKPGMAKQAEELKALVNPEHRVQHEKNYWDVADGIKLYHFPDGDGEKVLVVHGGPGFPVHKPWKGLSLLNENHTFQYYHQRGCGKSSRPIDTFSPRNYAKNVLALNAILGLGQHISDIERIRKILGQEKIIIIGHSFGGFLASMYAAEWPEHVKALVLVSPAAVLKMPSEGNLFEEIKKEMSPGMQKEYEEFLDRYFDYKEIFTKNEKDLSEINREFLKYFKAVLANNGHGIPFEKSDVKIAENGGWMVHGVYMSMGNKHDYRDALKVVDAPVLILHGENDITPLKGSRSYKKLLSNSKLRVIKGAGHFSFEEQPEAFAEAVGKFMASVEAN